MRVALRRQKIFTEGAREDSDSGLYIVSEARHALGAELLSASNQGAYKIIGQTTYAKDGNAADDGGVLGRGQGVVGRGNVALGRGGAAALPLDENSLGGHCEG